MPNVKIKQLEERVATVGLHMGGGATRRKLQPGEIVHIPEKFEAGKHGGQSLFECLWDTGKLEITPNKPNRPLEFATAREAHITSSTFKPRGPDEKQEIDRVKAKVASSLAITAGKTKSRPAPPVGEDGGVREFSGAAASPSPRSRRAARRGALQVSEHGEENTP